VEITGKRYVGRDWRKLLSTRRGTTIVAVACTLIAAAILVFALHRYRQSVNASGQPETVLVATQLIAKGTPGSLIAAGHLFNPTQIVAKQVSSGAIADASAITNKVTTVNIYPGQQLTAADFATSGDLATGLGRTQRAVSVPLAQGPGLIGQVQVGDHVDVYDSFLVTNAQGRSVPFTSLLVADATVLKAGSASGGGIGASSATQTSDVVLEVSQGDAAKLTFTAANGTLWLSLRSADSSPTPSQLITIDSILFGTKPIASGG
jgi:Flp pilus assembly protein CpaB